jgi:hypothetical protein
MKIRAKLPSSSARVAGDLARPGTWVAVKRFSENPFKFPRAETTHCAPALSPVSMHFPFLAPSSWWLTDPVAA